MLDFIFAGFALAFHVWAFVMVLAVVFGILNAIVGDDDNDPIPHGRDLF